MSDQKTSPTTSKPSDEQQREVRGNEPAVTGNDATVRQGRPGKGDGRGVS